MQPNDEFDEVDTPKNKKKKETIPISVKNTLWNIYFQNNLTGTCQCCRHEAISKNNFDCGHILSEKDGGQVSLDNLRPICRSCNSSMGTLNMDVFMKKYGFDKIEQINSERDTNVKSPKEIKPEIISTEKPTDNKIDKEELKMIKETEKLEKQCKETMELAIKLQKDADIAMDIAKKNHNDFITTYNQILGKCKNDELKKICQTLKMSKSAYSNKEEYLKAIFDFLFDKTNSEIKEIS